ncbi:carboxynorspermidine decarboxylase [Methylocaldum sp.]|uniref:carboxynorspermidine decarboxylase n=1 Tax=Methylocaldum sp. TaxID=1969727 RepID=UPI002D5CF71B|nr:carboxynorspermidine decarboxylase [Methylocaldum sp.]HYE34866.1 carboxynorspermidine decarboxylase [Methylocaldum sp.]
MNRNRILDIERLKHLLPETPAFVYDEARIIHALDLLGRVREACGLRILYSVKAFPFASALRLILPRADGFSVSSLFEARLASEVLELGGHHSLQKSSLHITTPGLKASEIDEIANRCDFVSFNSFEQFQRLGPRVAERASIGLRINPRLSFLDDGRYDPCRPYSKLGVPLDKLADAQDRDSSLKRPIDGLHFHTLFESRSFGPLKATLDRIESVLDGFMDSLKWINLGGGYLFESADDLEELADVVGALKQRRDIEVYFEPGKAIVGQSGYLVASVIDRFERNGKAIAVLDTGVNHLPEVFEYQKSPLLAEHQLEGSFDCMLVGSTCLAGDVFGEYRFAEPLSVGDRVVFPNVGAYSLIKANRFNGYDLPPIFASDRQGRIKAMKHFGYEDYRKQWTASQPSLAADHSCD